MLESLKIKNFRALEDFEVAKLGRVNLIVGKNNSGKSTVLEALQIYAGNANRGVLEKIALSRGENYFTSQQEIGDPKAALPFQDFFTNRKLPETDGIRIEIGNLSKKLTIEHILYKEPIYPYPGLTVLDQTRLSTPPTGPEKVSKSARSLLQFDEVIRPVLEVHSNDTLEAIFYLDQPSIPQNPYYPLKDINQIPCSIIPTQFIPTNELASEWDKIVFTENEEIVKQALRIITPEFEDLAFVQTDDQQENRTGRQRTAKVKLANTPRPISLNSLGDGMLRILQLSLKLVSAKGGFLLIDEFENGLHYSIQDKVWALLFKMAEKLDIQVFATTHSWDCIESFAKVAHEHSETEGIVFRMGKSARNSDRGRIIATVYDAEELQTVTQAEMEIR